VIGFGRIFDKKKKNRGKKEKFGVKIFSEIFQEKKKPLVKPAEIRSYQKKSPQKSKRKITRGDADAENKDPSRDRIDPYLPGVHE
jgi:hypothetical protein